MKSSLNLKQILTLFAIAVFISCGENKKAPDKNIVLQTPEEKPEIIKISNEELDEFGIDLAKAGPGKLDIHITLPGEIIIPPDNLAHIHPRFAGIVKEVRKHIGDDVNKGDVLAIIESNESLARYEIKSLISGTVVEKHFSLGEVVEGTEHGFVVADLNQVWAMLTLYQKDLPFIKTGQDVTISSHHDSINSTAKISYISPIIDEATRTAKARVVLDNPRRDWKPGLFISGTIATSSKIVSLIIPGTALETIDGRDVVFVKAAEGFVMKQVTIGKSNKLNVEILDGISAGDIYVSKGGFILKAELQKNKFGDDHH